MIILHRSWKRGNTAGLALIAVAVIQVIIGSLYRIHYASQSDFNTIDWIYVLSPIIYVFLSLCARWHQSLSLLVGFGIQLFFAVYLDFLPSRKPDYFHNGRFLEILTLLILLWGIWVQVKREQIANRLPVQDNKTLLKSSVYIFGLIVALVILFIVENWLSSMLNFSVPDLPMSGRVLNDILHSFTRHALCYFGLAIIATFILTFCAFQLWSRLSKSNSEREPMSASGQNRPKVSE